MLAALEARESALRPGRDSGPSAEPDEIGPSAGGSTSAGRDAGVGKRASRTTVHPTAVRERLAWRDLFIERMVGVMPGVEVVGIGQPRLWTTVSALMPETDCQQRWVVKLDKAGFSVSTGSACSSGQEKPSHVIAAMGYSPGEAGRVLRFSSGWETGEGDCNALLAGLQTVHRGMQEP